MPALSRPRLGTAKPGPAQGLWIAVTTFVPTFLATVFGIPYLAGLPVASRSPADLHGGTPATMASRAPERGFGEAPTQRNAPGEGGHAAGGTCRRAGVVGVNPDRAAPGQRPGPGHPFGNPSTCSARPTPAPIELQGRRAPPDRRRPSRRMTLGLAVLPS